MVAIARGMKGLALTFDLRVPLLTRRLLSSHAADAGRRGIAVEGLRIELFRERSRCAASASTFVEPPEGGDPRAMARHRNTSRAAPAILRACSVSISAGLIDDRAARTY